MTVERARAALNRWYAREYGETTMTAQNTDITTKICDAVDQIKSPDKLRAIATCVRERLQELGASETPTGNYKRLKDSEEIGAWIDADVVEGDKVLVSTKGGKTHTRVVSAVVWSGKSKSGGPATVVELEPWDR